MDILEAIDERKSRRRYLQTKIDVNKLKELYNVIEICNKEGNLFIKIIEDGSEAFNGFRKSYGMFYGVKTLIVLIGKKDDENLNEKAGYYGEKIVLKATELNLGTCWVGGSFDRNCDVFKIRDDESLVCVITVGNVEEEKSLKEKFLYKMIHRKNKSIEELYEADEKVPEWFIEGIKAVQKAPSALNKQPVKFKYNNGIVTASVDTLQWYRQIDLGIAKCHFEIAAEGRFNFGNNGEFVKKSSN